MAVLVGAGTLSCTARTQDLTSATATLPSVAVEAQPLAANVQRLDQALDSLGAPLPAELRAAIKRAGQARDARVLQELLDPRVLLVVQINPEARVKLVRGPAKADIQQAGYTPVLVKVVNDGGTGRLHIGSPQSGPVYAGMSELSGNRMQQQHLRQLPARAHPAMAEARNRKSRFIFNGGLIHPHMVSSAAITTFMPPDVLITRSRPKAWTPRS